MEPEGAGEVTRQTAVNCVKRTNPARSVKADRREVKGRTMTERKSSRRNDGHVAAAVQQGERVQAGIEAKDRARPKQRESGPVQAGTREYPDTFPAQHLKTPGREADLETAPMYEAPGYKGSGKLEGMAAIVTGGDSG